MKPKEEWNRKERLPKISIDDPDYYGKKMLPWGVTCDGWRAELRKRGLRARLEQVCNEIARKEKLRHNDAWYPALLQFPPEKLTPDMLETGSLEKFLARCREGFNMWLPQKASVEDEIAWISRNVERKMPDILKAPSYSSIAWLIQIKQSPSLADHFWKTYQAKRLSPGDKTAKKNKAYKEDSVDEAARDAQSHDDELVQRLFGTDE